MSKSRGNIVRAEPIRQVMGADALRSFLLREVVFGQDGSFSYDALIGRYNSELANGLGNLVSRTLTMINQYRGGKIPAGASDAAILELAGGTRAAVIRHFDAFEFSKGLEAIWTLLSAVDKFIVEQAPWKLARNPDAAAQAQLDGALYTSAETLRFATTLLYPVLPESTAKIWEQLGMTAPIESLRLDSLVWGQLPTEQKIGQIAGVFPRIDLKEAVEKMRQLEEEVSIQQAKLLGKPVDPKPPEGLQPLAAAIAIDDFVKVD